MNTLSVVVDAISRQGEHNLALTLVSSDGSPLPAFAAGAHIDVHLPNGLVRQYSLAGNPATADEYLLCIKKEAHSRGGSRFIHDSLRVGQQLDISPPRNLFALEDASRYLLLAGGIGITPILAMAETLDRQGKTFALYYYVKNRQQAAFSKRLQRGFQHGQVMLCCDDEGRSAAQYLPPELTAVADSDGLYMCGPEGFMNFIRSQADSAGWSEQQIHDEAFSAPQTATVADDETFTVQLTSSGAEFVVSADKTIAQVLQEHQVAIPLSCEMGICGACLTRVVEGQPDHRDSVQSDTEKQAAEQQIALCCSRSRSAKLVLDL